jgi:hypothetical protein
VFLEISLLAVFSDWLIFTACKMVILAISRISTDAVRNFPFFMVNWIKVIFDKVNAIRGQNYIRTIRTQYTIRLFCGK